VTVVLPLAEHVNERPAATAGAATREQRATGPRPTPLRLLLAKPTSMPLS
jgi:hypothetical protein